MTCRPRHISDRSWRTARRDFLFLGLIVQFYQAWKIEARSSRLMTSPMKLLCIEYVVALLITIRNIFRLAELSRGTKSTAPVHESY